MLLERIFYADDFPIRIAVSHLVEDPIHYHPDIEFVYVLQGEIDLKSGYCTYHLKAGDIFTNAGNEVHSMYAVSEDNVVAQIHVSTRDLSQFFPNLSKACYRTYSKHPNDKKHERLRDLMLQLLLKYELKDFNYKSECLYLMVDIIKHLDKHFNLFAFDKDMVVGFDRGNALAAERISRIVQYVYQNYANNITLQDLSEMEYLSSFYLSHLIKDFTGMNFREFLCFARVEMSEVRLLGSNKKISQIAHEVGFSTTSYYKKYFEKWFGYEPQEHRRRYLSQVKSDLRPGVFQTLPSSRAVAVVREAYSNQSAQQGDGSVVNSITLDVTVEPGAKSMGAFGRELNVVVSAADASTLGGQLFSALEKLRPHRVIVEGEEGDSQAERLAAMLRQVGFAVEQRRENHREVHPRYACDSIAFPICLVQRMMDHREIPGELYLRDTDSSELLQGQSSPLTARGCRKPSFYAYCAISAIRGDMIARGGQYCVVRIPRSGGDAFAIFVCNSNEALRSACMRDLDLMDVKHIINDYRDEMNLGVSLNLESGTYAVMKYSMRRENNVFAHLSALDFRRDAVDSLGAAKLLGGSPELETYLEIARAGLNVNFSLKGPGIQLAIIAPCGGES